MRPSDSGVGLGHGRIEPDVDAVVSIGLVDARRGVLIAHPRQDARRDLEYRDLDAEFGSGGRNLEPDQSAADYGQMLRRFEFVREPMGVRLGAQIMHARHAELAAPESGASSSRSR